MNTGHSLTTSEYIDKCTKLQKLELDKDPINHVKIRSLQLKIDNAIGGTSPRGRITHFTKEVEKTPNRKERRLEIQGKPKTAKAQIEIATQTDASGPTQSIAKKEREIVNRAKKDLHEFLKKSEGAKIIGARVSDNDEIVIVSTEKISLPTSHRGFTVINKISELQAA